MGKLNLLHHKSWHVYSKENKEKVRKDEEEAAKREEEKRRKVVKAEQEARMDRLRKAVGGDEEVVRVEEHVNLFKDLERNQDSRGAVLIDQKAVEEKLWQDKHTMFLGETKDGKKDMPWYSEKVPLLDPSSRSIATSSKVATSQSSRGGTDEQKRKRKDRQEDRRKKTEDPMEALRKFMDSRKSSGQPSSSHTVAKKSTSSSSSKTIEQLRQERLDRELQERNRTHELLNPSASATAAVHNSKKEFYNSQFNPSHVRTKDRR